MGNAVNFKEIADFCVNTYKNLHTKKDEYYVDTLYVAIYEDDSIEFSYTPHILSNAHRVILIHSHSALAVTNKYRWYKAECIKSNGAVSKNLDERFSISTVASGSFSNQQLRLNMNGNEIASFKLPVDTDKKINAFWDLYLGASECETVAEAKLLAKLNKACADNDALKAEIKDLEYSEAYLKTQLAEYENLLDDIKALVKPEE